MRLLIEPYGIETIRVYISLRHLGSLLIEPYGIETPLLRLFPCWRGRF